MYRASKYLFNGAKKEGCWVPYTVCLPMIKIVRMRVSRMRLEGEEGRGEAPTIDIYCCSSIKWKWTTNSSSLPLSACLSAMHACCQ